MRLSSKKLTALLGMRKELLPLYVPLLVALLIVTYVPPLTTLLPSLL